MSGIVVDAASGASWATTGSPIFETSDATSTVVISGFAEDDHGHTTLESVTEAEIDSLEVEEADVGTLDADAVFASYINAEVVVADEGEFKSISAKDTFWFDDVQYVVSDKYHNVAGSAAADEIDTSAQTIVTRSKLTGCRVSNLQVRSDSALFGGPFPGLYFADGWCTDQLTYLEDGHGYYANYTAGGVLIPDEHVRWGNLSATEHGYQVQNGTNIAVMTGGNLQLNSGTGQSGSPAAVLEVYSTSNVLQANLDDRGVFTANRTAVTSAVPVLACRDQLNVLFWTLNADGKFEHATHPVDDPTHAKAGSGPPITTDAIVLADESLFIGSGHVSYDRANHVLAFDKLKHQMPKYFLDAGYSTQNLPQGYTTATMSVQRYLALARLLQSNEALHLADVFPAANAVDWETLGTLGDFTLYSTTAQRNTITDAISAAKQNNLSFGLVSQTGKTVLSEDIKAYGDTNWASAGGGASTRFDFEANDTSYPQLSADSIDVIWTRSGGGSNGGAMSYELPATADMEDGHTIHVHCFQQHQSSSNGGTVFFKRKADQAFVSASFDHPQITAYQSNTCYISNVDRSSYALHFHKSGNIANWYLRCTSNTNLLHTNEDAIATNLAAIAKHQRHHIQLPISSSHLANSNQYQLPDGKTNISLHVGNGKDYTAQGGGQSQTPGYHVVLPLDPDEGTRIEVICHLNKNSSAADEVIVVQFPGGSYSGPNARAFVDHFGTETLASSSVSLACNSNTYSTRAWIFTYTEVDNSDGVWCVVQHTN